MTEQVSKSKGKEPAVQSPVKTTPAVVEETKGTSALELLLGDDLPETDDELDFIPTDDEEEDDDDEDDEDEVHEFTGASSSSAAAPPVVKDDNLDDEVNELFKEHDEQGGIEPAADGLRSGNKRNRVYNSAPKKGVVIESKKPKLW